MNIKATFSTTEQSIKAVFGEPTYKEGENAEYNRFWDGYQHNGHRGDYRHAFAGIGWNDDTYDPKHDMKITSAHCMFQHSPITDLSKKKLDFSQCIHFNYAFEGSQAVSLGVIDITNSTEHIQMFKNAKKLQSIEKIITGGNTTPHYDSMFQYTYALESVIFEGVIPQSINMRWCTKLDRNSHISAVNALAVTAQNKTATFSKIAVNKAFETNEGANNGSTSQEWLNLIANKTNWLIALV